MNLRYISELYCLQLNTIQTFIMYRDIFSIGLFKKVVLADTFSFWATNGFDKADSLDLISAWTTSLSYTLQLYFDFSGYADMAIGIALLFNIKLPLNFNSPYKAKNIQNFWRMWHMTLSRFLRDYIYLPLGGNRAGTIKTYTNLMTTFLIGGIWHGAGWTFIFWGFLHGSALVVHRMWRQLSINMNDWIAWLLTFNFVNITWIFFRAKSWDDAIKVLKSMIGFNGVVLPGSFENYIKISGVVYDGFLKPIGGTASTFAWLLAGISIVTLLKNSNELIEHFKPNILTFIFNTLLLLISLSLLSGPTEFLYFNF